ncbi:uncharacterized protein C8Q71DRAFT_722861 [Rhodofomes roseus]|uniref:Uncharacterized protein n=1 Tax=Rhodofomes roseus TaxID=34475 RepID=A0ABQ8KLE7_9APHY|nr:uncharacterized protein C8Q71DRAFT_722861 [Rhodofomes roseus]KAH9838768.1 hypothetical protein C8Q71DRAFT_722861 [Rhodofomes roseus]
MQQLWLAGLCFQVSHPSEQPPVLHPIHLTQITLQTCHAWCKVWCCCKHPKKPRAAAQSSKAKMVKNQPVEVSDSGDDYVPEPKQQFRQAAKHGPSKHVQSAKAKPNLVMLPDEENVQEETADVATVASSDDEPIVSTEDHGSTPKMRRRHSFINPEWDTELVGSNPNSPIKSKDKVRAKRIEHPTPVADEEAESLNASPPKQSHTMVEAVFIEGKRLDTIIETSKTLKCGKQPSGKDRDNGIPGAVFISYMMPKLELFPSTGNETIYFRNLGRTAGDRSDMPPPIAVLEKFIAVLIDL